MLRFKSPEQIDRHYDIDPTVKAEVDTAYQTRQAYANDIRNLMPFLPELPDTTAQDTYERILEHERRVAPNLERGDYGEGTAKYDDEILTEISGGRFAISADHATDPVRKATGIREDADHGTAGLALALSEAGLGDVVLPRGRQLSNANVAVAHPMKDKLATILPGKDGFLSVHGMAPGKFTHQLDEMEIHGVLGLGKEPTEASRDLASDMITHAKNEYGLRLVAGNDTRFFAETDRTPRLDYDESGNPKYTARLAALGEGSTTNFVNQLLQAPDFPALQIEISRTLRLLPKEMEYREERAKVMSVYMGYLITHDLVELALSRQK
jgi:hypothetical protein